MSGNRGAVLVHVAVAMSGLLAFAALSIDLGMIWVARAEAQNAADAGALAGTVSLAYVNPTDADMARAAAAAVVARHDVWGVAGPSAVVTTGACPTGAPAAPGECVGVRVTQTLPAFFSRLFGQSAATVAASASAKVMGGNNTPCPRPFAIPDRWLDRHDTAAPVDGDWTSDDVFDGYDGEGNPTLPAGTRDVYTPPSGSAGTGLTVADFAGRRVVRTQVNPALGLPMGADQMLSLDLPRPGEEDVATPERYESNITSCSGLPMSLGASATAFNPHSWEYTYRGLRTLIAQDTAAIWDGTAVRGSQFPISPRIVTIAVFDPEAYSSRPRTGTTSTAIIVRNLIGLFVERVDQDSSGAVQLTGVIVPTAGRFDSSAPPPPVDASFLRGVALVR